MERFVDFLIKTLTPRVAPMVYVMMGVSVFIGLCFYTGWLVENGESILFANGAVIPVKEWGGLLFLAAGLSEIGLIAKWWSLVTWGSLAAFALWLLATIDLAQGNHWYTFIVLGLFHMFFQGYVYLAASVGVLERGSYRD